MANMKRFDHVSWTYVDTLIGDYECTCVQFCDIPDIFCSECGGTGEVAHLKEHLEKYDMTPVTKSRVKTRKSCKVRD